jgi:hypothetical protein
MKKTFYLLFLMLFMAAAFTASPAKADAPGDPCNGADPFNNCSTPGNAVLRINNNVVYMLMAGVVIGIVAINRYKAHSFKPE